MLRLKTLAAGSAMAVFLALAGPGSASAATEFGDACTGNNDYSSGVTFFESSAPANPLPVAAPSAGVITKWKVNVVPVPSAFPQTIKLLRLNPSSHTALVVSETPVSLSGGLNAIDARVPVQAGDRLSLFGSSAAPPVETLICTTAEENLIGGFSGNGGGVGSSNPYIELPDDFRVPLAAVIEPDADGDGYGDETQDKCPQDAAVQGECPVVILDSLVVPKKSSVVVVVNVSTPAPVTVSASVKLPKATKKATASAVAKLKKVTHDVTPGKLRYFSLKYPASLKGALADLPKGKKLKLKITASATNVAGQVSKDKTTVKLKGTA